MRRQMTWKDVGEAVLWTAVAAAALTYGTHAHAQIAPIALSCTLPTLNTDGSPIKTPVTVTFYMGTSSSAFPNTSPALTACAYNWPVPAPGMYYFVATAADADGAMSLFSNVASASRAPPGLAVDPANLTAYQLVLSNKRIGFLSVGTVAAGTLCDASQPVGNKFVIDRAAVVSWFGNAKPQLVVAACL